MNSQHSSSFNNKRRRKRQRLFLVLKLASLIIVVVIFILLSFWNNIKSTTSSSQQQLLFISTTTTTRTKKILNIIDSTTTVQKQQQNQTTTTTTTTTGDDDDDHDVIVNNKEEEEENDNDNEEEEEDHHRGYDNQTSLTTSSSTVVVVSSSSRNITTTTRNHRGNNDNNFLKSPACYPKWPSHNNITRIFFSHTRKAGGSYIRRILQHVAIEKNLTLVVVEGKHGWENRKRSDTFYVTNLRHPISRILSSYKYEGRWDCNQLVTNTTISSNYNSTKRIKTNNIDNNNNNNNNYFEPTSNNSKSLEEFISSARKPIGCNKSRKRGGMGVKLLWICVENYYLRLYGHEFDCLDKIHKSYYTALNRLTNDYNLIVVTEWLQKSSKYRQGLLKFLGLNNPNHRHYGMSMYCGKESKHYNDLYPAIIKNETIQKLFHINQKDIKLYHALTKNTQQNNICNGPENVVFS